MHQICCLNPDCDNPTVPDTTKFCPNCGIPLVTLKGIYRPVKTLGSGGFGKTYLAENIGKFNEKCVIKLFAPQTQSTYALKKAMELFEEEAKRLQLLNHPQIPNLQLYFEENGYLYLIQDFIDGDNLLVELANGANFDERRIKNLLLEILPILQIVHNQKIIHRDIKPENIMRRRGDGKLFLIDFGASKQVQGTMRPGTQIGSFGYASLEQMEDREVYPASDLFSLGASCFHLMTRIHPWALWKLQGYGWVEKWRDHVKQPVSQELGIILDKLLQLEYQNRYQSAAELLQVLQNQPSRNSGSSQNQSSVNSASSQNQSSVNSASSQNQSSVNSASSQNQSSVNLGSSQNQSSVNSASSQNQSSVNSGSSQNQSSVNSASSQNQTYPNSASSQNQPSRNSGSSQNQSYQNSGNPQNQPSRNSGSSQNQTSRNSGSSQNQSYQNSGNPQNQPSRNSGSSQNQTSRNSGSSQNLTRRNFLIYPSLFVGGVTVAFLGQQLFKDPKNQSSENSTSENSTPNDNQTSENQTPKNQTSENLQTFNFEVVKTNSQGEIINRSNASAKCFWEDLGNGVTLQMVEIPEGSFIMGSPESEKSRQSDESPQRRVTVPRFFMGRYQLTQEQYQAIMANNPSRFKGSKRPVERVSYDDAVEFCQRLSQKTGKNYILPSEAQWEYACRAGTTTPFYFGKSITPKLVNYHGNYPYGNAPKGEYRKQTTNVGSFPPNRFGLYDMHGNVWEWCLDDWVNNYNNAPTDGSAVTGRSTSRRLLRGGSWNSFAGFCRSANRLNFSRVIRINSVGFRVVVIPRTL